MARYNETRTRAESGNNKLLDLIYNRFKQKLTREFKRTYQDAIKQYDSTGLIPESLYQEHQTRLKELLTQVNSRAMRSGSERLLRTFLDALWLDAKTARDIAKEKAQEFQLYAAREAEIDARYIADTTRKDISTLISRAMESKGLLGDKLSALLLVAEEKSIYRTLVVGFTNIHGALNFGQQETAKSTTDEDYNHYKIWVTAKDERVRSIPKGATFDHVLMEGVEVLIDQKFSIPGGARADGPGDRSTPLGNFINCRCFLRYRRELKK